MEDKCAMCIYCQEYKYHWGEGFKDDVAWECFLNNEINETTVRDKTFVCPKKLLTINSLKNEKVRFKQRQEEG